MDAKRRPISPQAAARYMRRWPIVRRRLTEEQRADLLAGFERTVARTWRRALFDDPAG